MTLLLTLMIFSYPWNFDRSLIHKGCRAPISATRYDSTHTFDVEHYSIDLSVNFEHDSIYDCETTIRSVSTCDTMTWAKFHLCDLIVDSVLLNGDPATFIRTGSGENALKTKQSQRHDKDTHIHAFHKMSPPLSIVCCSTGTIELTERENTESTELDTNFISVSSVVILCDPCGFHSLLNNIQHIHFLIQI